MKSKDQLSGYLKDNKEDHYNNVIEKDFTVSTGSLVFDIELGGGVPPSIQRLSGVSGGGKTSITLSILNNFLKEKKGKDRKGLYVKAEGRLSRQIRERSGVKFVDKPDEWEEGTCFIFKTNVYETAANLIESLVNNNEDDISYYFIFDSMDALIPKGDKEKLFEDAMKVSGGATISSHFLRKMSLPFSVGGHMCSLISQVRSDVKINPYAKGDPKLTNGSGGNSLLHYPDWIWEVQPRYKDDQITKTIKGKEEIIGHWAKVIFRKSSNEKDGKMVRYPIKHDQVGGNSVWKEYEIGDLLLMWGMANKKGAWINIEDDLIEELKENKIEFNKQIQGMDNLYLALEENQKATDYLFFKFKELCIAK